MFKRIRNAVIGCLAAYFSYAFIAWDFVPPTDTAFDRLAVWWIGCVVLLLSATFPLGLDD